MQESYTVYMHVVPSGKRYIGITKRKPEERWKNGKGYSHNSYFTRAIKKYGWANIKHIILCTGLTRQEAEEKEIELIAMYRTNERLYGYNRAIGGGLNNGWKHSRESIEKNKLHQPRARMVEQYSISGELLNTYNSVKEAERLCNITHPMVLNCCKGRQSHAGGFLWKYSM